MRIKKLLSVALITCATLSSTMVANADTKDSSLPTEYISSTKSTYSNYREKNNTSYIYIKNMCGLQLKVIAYYTNPSPDTPQTKHGYAVIPGNVQRFINNSVYEAYKSDNKQGLSKGKKCNCRLYIRADISGSSGRLYGKWSPDSVGNYPVANP